MMLALVATPVLRCPISLAERIDRAVAADIVMISPLAQ